MNSWEFENFLKKICSYYGKKDGNDKSRNNLHFNKISFIPGGQVLDSIFEQITNEYEYFPRNLPKAIKNHWGVWQSANPEKMKKESSGLHSGCSFCLKGWIHFVIYSKMLRIPYRHVSVCGHCRANEHTNLPVHTVDQVSRMGGEIY